MITNLRDTALALIFAAAFVSLWACVERACVDRSVSLGCLRAAYNGQIWGTINVSHCNAEH